MSIERFEQLTPLRVALAAALAFLLPLVGFAAPIITYASAIALVNSQNLLLLVRIFLSMIFLSVEVQDGSQRVTRHCGSGAQRALERSILPFSFLGDIAAKMSLDWRCTCFDLEI